MRENAEPNPSGERGKGAPSTDKGTAKTGRSGPSTGRLYAGATMLFLLIVVATPVVLLWGGLQGLIRLVLSPLRSDEIMKVAT